MGVRRGDQQVGAGWGWELRARGDQRNQRQSEGREVRGAVLRAQDKGCQPLTSLGGAGRWGVFRQLADGSYL